MTSPPRSSTFGLATVAGITAGTLLALGAILDAATSMNADQLSPAAAASALSRLLPDGQRNEDAIRSSQAATLQAIRSMATSRTAILTALSATAMLLAVTSLRLRVARPGSARLARQLATVATMAAVLRTLAGAQNLAIARSAARAFAASLPSTSSVEAAARLTTLVQASSTSSILWTATVVAALLALAAYFRRLVDVAPKRFGDDEP